MAAGMDSARRAIEEYLARRAVRDGGLTPRQPAARGAAKHERPQGRPGRAARAPGAAKRRRKLLESKMPLARPVTMASPQDAQGKVQLTWRQMQTLILIADGKTTREIASALGISFKTAAAHRANLMQRLGLHNSADVVRYAIRTGVVRP